MGVSHRAHPICQGGSEAGLLGSVRASGRGLLLGLDRSALIHLRRLKS